MAEQNLNLPELDKTPSDAQKTETSTGILSEGAGVNTKEMVIGFGAVLIAAIIFFVIKNYVARMLVASYKKSPRSADMAGWSLFCILLFAAIIATLGILDSAKFLTLAYLIPIGLAMLVSLITFIMALLSKR